MTTDLRNPPTDAISRIVFSPVQGEDLLLVSSWDSKVRLYDVGVNEIRVVQSNPAAILDCCFLRDSKSVVYGGLAREVRLRTFDRATDSLLGAHNAPVRCVEFHPETNTVFSGGWDKCLKSWDLRMRCAAQEAVLPGKIFTMGVGGNKVLVGDSKRMVSIFDVRNLSQPEQQRENVLKYQYRSLRCFPDGTGFALSSVEGRVAWEFFSPPGTHPNQKKYAFKCHREKDGGIEVAYPVNTLAFHPTHGTFATGGGDGGVSVWDGYNKRRLWRLSFPTSITSLCFSANGSQLAVAASYDFAQGPKSADQNPAIQLTIRQVKDEDVRPRTTAKIGNPAAA